MDIKSKMKEMGIKQVDMISKLRERGVVVQPPMLSSVLNGLYTYPKAKVILTECEKILNEIEKK